MKIGRNDDCPCGSGKKHKHCHGPLGVDFDGFGYSETIRHLSVRGKNIIFINRIAEALQLDSVDRFPKSFGEFVSNLKRAITPKAVKTIYSAIPEIWPDGDDLNRCLALESQGSSGLYIGNYLFDVTVQLLNRHALYDQTIILIDPFGDPRCRAAEYNPLIKPEEYITTTFHWVLLWLQLAPWIEAGIIRIIQNPGDFDYQLRKETMEISRQRAECDELRNVIKNEAHLKEFEESFKDQIALSYPDEYWVKKAGEKGISATEMKGYIQRRRDESLYYVDVGNKSQIIQWSSGTSYEMGKYICERTKSHIITDLSYRWREMEYDRRVNGVHVDAWTPFAKSIQSCQIKHLDGLSLSALLKLRNDGYLDDMRSFLRRVWSSCSTADQFDLNNIENLSAELQGRIAMADSEWKKIDANLAKWFSGEAFLGATIGIAAGAANWVPSAAAVAIAGGIQFLQSQKEKRGFISAYPAAFFIESIRGKS